MAIKSTFLSVFLVALVGCGAQPKPPAPLASEPTVSDLAQSLKYSDFIKQCPLLPIVPATAMNVPDVIKLYIVLEGQYNDCASNHDCLIASVVGTNVCHQQAAKPQESKDGK